jgi:hypothetical protein
LGGEGETANGRARDGDNIKAWMKARNDHVRVLRKNATRSGRATSGFASSADRLNDPRLPVGDLANAAGLAAGAVRGVAHLADGVYESAKMAEHMLDPFYAPLHPSTPAWRPVFNAAHAGLHAGKEVVLHPAETFRRANVALNPGATPIALTVAGEARRRFDIGKNQGEVGFDIIAGMAAPEAVAARALPVEEQAARWMAKGLTEPQARYMTEPYVGMGHHYYPRSGKLPPTIGGVSLPKSLANRPMPLPRVLSDSPFNVLKPQGISRGDFYEKHVAVDSHYRGGRFPAHVGGTWSRTKLGLKTHGAIGRVVHGAPTALKRTVSGAAGGAGGVVAVGRREKRQ